MSRLESLRSASSLSDLATLLKFRPSGVSYILYKRTPAENYKTFTIPKRTGGSRTIEAPIEGLKVLQRRLSDLLQDCIDEIQEGNQRVDRIAHGFVRKKSIITNAHQHRRRRWVFNIDLEDFFASINFGRIRGFLMKNRDFELPESVATVAAQIACHNNSLPQGSPCSPVLSNLIGHVMDVRLVRLASNAGCNYTRYVDDLTFSTNKAQFPTEIATLANTNDESVQTWEPSADLRGVIHRCGFRINTQKTRLMYRFSRQEVTGLVVNEKINVRREYRRSVRAMVHSLTATGGFKTHDMPFRRGRSEMGERPGTLDELRGMLGFINSIDNRHACTKEQRRSKQKVYRAFLMYSVFHVAERPVIVCEGKTDNVYLKHAIRSLSADFPELADVTSDAKIPLKVRLYRYAQSGSGGILGLNAGGSSALAGFVATYGTSTKGFTQGVPKSPVVIVYDNDGGAKPIRKAIKSSYGVTVEDTPFTHVFRNLYAVATPGLNSKIEDLFSDAVMKTTIGGKTFNPDRDDFDKRKHYGKAVFARRVVAARAAQIDFAQFRPLLGGIVDAIQHFRHLDRQKVS